MYLERVPHKQGHKTYYTWLIRESYGGGGKVRQRTIANITKLPHQLRCKIQHWLKQGGQLDPSSTKLSVRNSREYGASGAFVQFARKLGLERLKSVRTVDVSVSGAVVAGLITSADAEQQRILQLLGVKLWTGL